MAEHKYTSAPICPYCEHMARNHSEIDFGPGLDGDTTHNCGNCGEDYFLERIVTVQFSSYPLETASTGVSHD